MKKEKGNLKERIFSYLCILPGFLGVLVFFVVPFIIVVYYSTINNPILHEYVGLTNYKALLQNTAFKQAAWNSAYFSLISVPLSIVLSIILALMLERSIPYKSALRTFFLSPLMVPTASVVIVWQVLFHNHGTINQICEMFGGNGVDWIKSPHGQIIIVAMFLWKNLGYNMILFMSALAGVPKDILEVADLEGAGKLYQFFRIKLRYLSPTIVFVLILSIINSFKVFREVYLLTGDHPVSKMYMLQHFMNNTFKSLDYQKLSAAAVLFAIVMIAVLAIILTVDRIFGKDLED